MTPYTVIEHHILIETHQFKFRISILRFSVVTVLLCAWSEKWTKKWWKFQILRRKMKFTGVDSTSNDD